MGGGGGGGKPTAEQRKLQKLQLAEFDKVKAEESRRLQALQRARVGKMSLVRRGAAGLPDNAGSAPGTHAGPSLVSL